MADAERIEFLTTEKVGDKVEFDCLTKIGPFTVRDSMRVINWDEPNSITVVHKGLFKGEGTLSLQHLSPEYCEIHWSEQIAFPPFLLGPIGAQAAKPILERIWKKNLERLETLLKSSS